MYQQQNHAKFDKPLVNSHNMKYINEGKQQNKVDKRCQ